MIKLFFKLFAISLVLSIVALGISGYLMVSAIGKSLISLGGSGLSSGELILFVSASLVSLVIFLISAKLFSKRTAAEAKLHPKLRKFLILILIIFGILLNPFVALRQAQFIYQASGKVGSLMDKYNNCKVKDGFNSQITFTDTRLREEYSCRKGVRQGSFKTYFNNELFMEGNYKDGKLDELIKKYTSNQVVVAEYQYHNGLINGPFKEYYSNGIVSAEGNFKDAQFAVEDYYDGPYKSYTESGKIRNEGSYKNGKFSGTLKNYSTSKGREYVESEYIYVNGQITETKNYTEEGILINKD